MSALDLKATLSVLENGIIIMEKEQISIPIDAESLMPLLTHSDRDIRLRALTIAGNAKMTTTTQSANLR